MHGAGKQVQSISIREILFLIRVIRAQKKRLSFQTARSGCFIGEIMLENQRDNGNRSHDHGYQEGAFCLFVVKGKIFFHNLSFKGFRGQLRNHNRVACTRILRIFCKRNRKFTVTI